MIGIKQSGLPQLRVTNLVTDAGLSSAASDDIRDVLQNSDRVEDRNLLQRIEEYTEYVDMGAVA